jgi:hypothetical protein
MKEISTTGWIIMGCFGVFIILINIGLWTAWRHRDTSQGEWLHRFTQGMSNPFAKEDSQLKELSTRVEHLKHDSTEDFPHSDHTNE